MIEGVAKDFEDEAGREIVTAAAATVSYFRCPYGWSSSGGRSAARIPMRPTMLEPVSVRE